jgi:ribose 5-phosphate isomerase B
LCKKVLATGRKGILVCGSGIGMAIAANRHAGIRAALCTHESQAKTARSHNDANVICFGGRLTASALACSMAEIFLAGEFAGGRHQRRLEQMDKKGSRCEESVGLSDRVPFTDDMTLRGQNFGKDSPTI